MMLYSRYQKTARLLHAETPENGIRLHESVFGAVVVSSSDRLLSFHVKLMRFAKLRETGWINRPFPAQMSNFKRNFLLQAFKLRGSLTGRLTGKNGRRDAHAQGE